MGFLEILWTFGFASGLSDSPFRNGGGGGISDSVAGGGEDRRYTGGGGEIGGRKVLGAGLAIVCDVLVNLYSIKRRLFDPPTVRCNDVQEGNSDNYHPKTWSYKSRRYSG